MNKEITTIYVVRHAQSKHNAGETSEVGMPLGSELSSLGVYQAQEIANHLSDIPFAAVYSSDLLRASQTAEAIARNYNLTVITSDGIREREFDREKFARVHPNEQISDLLQSLDEQGKRNFKATPDTESSDDGAKRLLEFIQEISQDHNGKNILVVTHGNIMRSFLTYLDYANFDELPFEALDNTGYFILENNENIFTVMDVQKVKKQKDKVRTF